MGLTLTRFFQQKKTVMYPEVKPDIPPRNLSRLELVTDERGTLACDAQIDTPGQIELIAQAKDGAGHPAQAATGVWVTRRGELWFAQANDDRIDVLPEKPRYEPGETARLQVRMPYREATALVSVEREGLIDTRVVTLRGNDPTIELKIDKAFVDFIDKGGEGITCCCRFPYEIEVGCGKEEDSKKKENCLERKCLHPDCKQNYYKQNDISNWIEDC